MQNRSTCSRSPLAASLALAFALTPLVFDVFLLLLLLLLLQPAGASPSLLLLLLLLPLFSLLFLLVLFQGELDT
jgi:hypothetical protein